MWPKVICIFRHDEGCEKSVIVFFAYRREERRGSGRTRGQTLCIGQGISENLC